MYVNQTNRYDVRENLIEQAYFDKNAKPRDENGSVKIEQIWRDGTLVERDFYALTEDRRLYIYRDVDVRQGWRGDGTRLF